MSDINKNSILRSNNVSLPGLADGSSNQKYGYSARSLMGISKYYAGSPFYRQGSLQDLLGVSISASSIFDQTENLLTVF